MFMPMFSGTFTITAVPILLPRLYVYLLNSLAGSSSLSHPHLCISPFCSPPLLHYGRLQGPYLRKQSVVWWHCHFPVGQSLARKDGSQDHGGDLSWWWQILFLEVQPPMIPCPPYSAYFLKIISDGFSSWHLPTPSLLASLPVNFSAFFSFLLLFLSCCHLNFLSSYQVWSDFLFCHKRVLERL